MNSTGERHGSATPLSLCELCVQSLRKQNYEVRRVPLARGQRLFQEGDIPRSVYVLKRGLIKVYLDVEAGHQATVRLVHPGELFGLTSMLDDAPYSLSAMALEPCEVEAFSSAAFYKALETDVKFSRSVLRLVARNLRNSRLDLLQRAEHDATSRVAAHLIELMRLPGAAGTGGEGYRVNRSTLGELSGVAIETVSRILGKLEAKRYIRRSGRGIHITDQQGLEELGEQCHNGQGH